LVLRLPKSARYISGLQAFFGRYELQRVRLSNARP
jgi:hypothetical protein